MSEIRKCVLVVDDTPANIDILKSILAGDYTVRACVRGEQALKLAHKQPQPDLILLDVMMPGMDGFEVCEHLKLDPITADIPIIFLTGDGEDAARERGLALGAAAYMVRPVAATDLLDTIAGILKHPT